MNFAPGDDYLYSNTGYFLLSLVIKKASGKSLREFAQEHIFATLGLKDTQILDDHTKVITRKAASYAPTRDGGFCNVTSNWEQTGDGAVQTTVGDFAKWDANFYTGKVGGSALVRELETTDVLNDGTPINYALGLTVDQYRGLRRVAHRGSWDGLRSYYSRTTMTVRRFTAKEGQLLAGLEPGQVVEPAGGISIALRRACSSGSRTAVS